jgi:hypothetical protein
MKKQLKAVFSACSLMLCLGAFGCGGELSEGTLDVSEGIVGEAEGSATASQELRKAYTCPARGSIRCRPRNPSQSYWNANCTPGKPYYVDSKYWATCY